MGLHLDRPIVRQAYSSTGLQPDRPTTGAGEGSVMRFTLSGSKSSRLNLITENVMVVPPNSMFSYERKMLVE